jgi:iron complex transport system ATP-binding protein
VIHARRLGYRVRSAVLLQNVEVSVRPGRVTAVVGANGAGKSTLLRLLSGELEPTAGGVWLDDRPISGMAARDVARRRAVMPQASTLNFPFRVFDVVLLGRTPHVRGREAASDRDAVLGALETARALDLADRRYTTLSGGERQRADFARALAQVWNPTAQRSRYLLLDEPTASLDLARQHEVLHAVAGFARGDVGVLVVLHDLNLAARYADEVLVLKEGRVAAQGAPWSVLTPGRIEDAFGLPVVVTNHPCHDCPLVVADPTAPPSSRPTAGATPSPEGRPHGLSHQSTR